jgi:hypothetical protein
MAEFQHLNLAQIDAQAAQAKHSDMQNAIGKIMFAEEQRKVAERQGLQDMWAQSGGDPNKALETMMRDPRYYTQAVKMQSEALDIGKKKVDIRKTGVEADKGSQEYLSREFAPLLDKQDLNHQDVLGVLQRAKSGGYNVDGIFSTIPGDPAKLGQWTRSQIGTGIAPDKTLERYTPKTQVVNLGGADQVIDLNANTNPSIVGQTFTKTATPGEIMTDQRQRDLADIQRQNGKAPPGYRLAPDGSRLEPVPGGPADIGKALPSPAVKELGAAGTSVENTKRLAGSFKDDFGGKYILGDMANKFGRVFGDDTGQSQWWQDMDAQQNQTRHELFGSALTKTELNAWEKTSVTPNMNPTQIKENLARRAEIESRAASKIARAYQAAGYNKAQIAELLGTASQYLENPAPPAGVVGANKRPAASTPPNWSSVNADYADGQPGRESDRLTLLQNELQTEVDPANRAALTREIDRVQKTQLIADARSGKSAGSATPQPAAPQGSSFTSKAMPNPAQYKGHFATDQNTGVRYQSNGTNWVRVTK